MSVRGRVALAVPDISVTRHDPQGPLLTTAADEERHPGLDGGRVIAQFVAADPAALLVRRLFVEHSSGKAAGLVKAADPVADREHLVPERVVLRLVPTGTESEHRPTAAGVVEHRRHLHRQADVPVPHAADHDAKGHAGRPGGPAREGHPALEDRPASAENRPVGIAQDWHEVVVGKQAREAERLDALASRHEIRPGHSLAPDLEADPDGCVGTQAFSEKATDAGARRDRSAHPPDRFG